MARPSPASLLCVTLGCFSVVCGRHATALVVPAAPTLSRSASWSFVGGRREVGRVRKQHAAQLQMCICIHCSRVRSCVAYHFVETKHRQPHMTETPQFEPRSGSPTVHVTVRSKHRGDDDDGEYPDFFRPDDQEEEEAVLSRQEAQMALSSGAMRDALQEAIGNPDDSNIKILSVRNGEVDIETAEGKPITLKLPILSIEYDVVKCADFLEEKDCWVNNMPEEIRRANPHFVPP